jgi:hypothetical protein
MLCQRKLLPSRIARLAAGVLAGLLLACSFSNSAAAQSMARQWNESLLGLIRIDIPKPTVHARNLYHTSAAMYDAWAAFDPYAKGTFFTEKHTAANLDSARNEAISYAAYRVLTQRYSIANNPVASQAAIDNRMSLLGYDKNITTTVGNSPAAIGNRIAALVLGESLGDGSNEANRYVDTEGYSPINPPMTVDYPSVVSPTSPPFVDPNRWQPLYLSSSVTQNGIEGSNLQVSITPHWGNVTTFAMGRSGNPEPHSWSGVDPGPPPKLGEIGDAQYRADTVDSIRKSGSLDPNAGPGTQLINLSPRVNGNRPLGTNNNQGYAINPVTQQPYADNFAKVGDFGRVLAEYWADGPHSETPPGHWNLIANTVADSPLLSKRMGGTGPVMSDLEWDVKTYLALNGAVHDAGVAAWGTKTEYDYVRPITKVRYQGSLGQSSDVNDPSYHPNGLPLEPGLIELITAQSIAPGGVHRNVYDNANQDSEGNFLEFFLESELVGKVAIKAWNHQPADPVTQVSGADWILAENWVPFQADTFVTPAFAAYVSGHSTFSRSAAEVLTDMTGSAFFPGGLGEATFTPGFLRFEQGPSQPVTLQWATYFDAADEAGQSRLWGGIHVPADDFAGRVMGHVIGNDSFSHAKTFFTGPGDFTADGAYTCSDINQLTGTIAAGTNTAAFDLTGDGLVNQVDLQAWLTEAGYMTLSSRRPFQIADANLDGVVDGSDFGIWNTNKFTSNSAWCSGNFNGDSVVDGTDFGLWNARKFTTADGSSLVPEPGLAGWLVGVVLLAPQRRRFAARQSA